MPAHPHFYRAFYVYKYATGLSAAIALAERVSRGGVAELGGLSPPRRLLAAGPTFILLRGLWTWRSPSPRSRPDARFGKLVEELEGVLK